MTDAEISQPVESDVEEIPATQPPPKRKRPSLQQRNLKEVDKWLNHLQKILTQLSREWQTNFPLVHQVEYLYRQKKEHQEILLELPLMGAASFEAFLTLIGAEKQNFCERLSKYDLSIDLIRILTTYLADCKNEALDSMPSADTATTSMSSTLVPGSGTSVSVTPDPNLPSTSGFSALLDCTPYPNMTGPISSSISVQTDTSYNTYTAPMEPSGVIMDLNLYHTSKFLAATPKERWREAWTRLKSVPLTAPEYLTIKSVLEKVADRVRSNPQLQVTHTPKK